MRLNAKGKKIRNTLGFYRNFIVDSKGLSGGLVFLWSSNIHIEMESCTNYHISVSVIDPDHGKSWLLTGFYGNPNTVKREASWHLLRMIKPTDNKPWLCMGDYNEILQQNEKVGGDSRKFSQMESFRQVLQQTDLRDMGYRGPKFT